MSKTSPHDGDVVRNLLSVADLLEHPELARLYAYVYRAGPTTVGAIVEALDLPQGTAYTYVDRLQDSGVLTTVDDTQPREFGAVDIELSVSAADGRQEYTVRPALIDAVGRRLETDDIDVYIDRHGIAGLATALSYAVARQHGETTHRLMARDLDISAIEAEVILQALEPVVRTHYEIDSAGASLAEVRTGEDVDDENAGGRDVDGEDVDGEGATSEEP